MSTCDQITASTAAPPPAAPPAAALIYWPPDRHRLARARLARYVLTSKGRAHIAARRAQAGVRR